MKDKPIPVVTYRQIRKAFFGNHESVMSEAQANANQATNDNPLEAAMLMASLGNALDALEKADKGDPVLIAPHHQAASLLQSYVAEECAKDGKLVELAIGGLEAQFDQHDLGRWFLSLFTWWRGIKPHTWQNAPAAPEILPGNGTTRLALLGDWGTGLYGAPVCGSSIESDAQGYQALFHLGDVYYSGGANEISERFLQYWPVNSGAVSRALNSNHEMYTGAHAYFDQTLAQFGQAASYFALQNDHWLLAGLDSAYATPDKRHEKAHLQEEQIVWLQNLVAQKGERKLILFSHHQPLSWWENQPGDMNSQLAWLLNGQDIFAWYWGHEHRCALYEKHPLWGFYGRCVGHGGFPYFRDQVSHLPLEYKKGDAELRRMTATDAAPGGLLLDGPNPYLSGEENKYGPHGYMTLEFNGAGLNEIVHAPDGTRIYERALP